MSSRSQSFQKSYQIQLLHHTNPALNNPIIFLMFKLVIVAVNYVTVI